ncbi:hypothetical protein ALI22I_34260 [Saccharothrix sp. ALI-22-I]|uniref:hypothetical protein n=1 Tax=Saccharothrix sp. ALI-22-I TaxID=1933778 RepID=UPI00097C350C|nr:hypothetical protein [Saccharothrix sp. ALI-22-I]ONI83551.1 hypothetical protein ALI22I_34260 [Saccharothrix sp. ALI-22-I]
MNTTLPPARDLPPHRHHEIRARLEREVAGGRRSIRFAPLITAGVAVAAAIALVTVVVAPWQQPGGVGPAASGSAVHPTTVRLPPPSPAEKPVIPNLSPERIAQIEEGCPKSAGVPGKAVLHQYLTDAAGTFGLLYTGDTALGCTIDIPTMPYNAGFSSGFDVEWLPGEASVDHVGAKPGGDVDKAEYAGLAGYDMAYGRVSAKVAKVTYTLHGQTAEATVANGTFVARIIHPSNWEIPDNFEAGEIQAYDAQGNLISSAADRYGPCYVRPGDYKIVVGDKTSDPKTCWPAVSWRNK